MTRLHRIKHTVQSRPVKPDAAKQTIGEHRIISRALTRHQREIKHITRLPIHTWSVPQPIPIPRLIHHTIKHHRINRTQPHITRLNPEPATQIHPRQRRQRHRIRQTRRRPRRHLTTDLRQREQLISTTHHHTIYKRHLKTTHTRRLPITQRTRIPRKRRTRRRTPTQRHHTRQHRAHSHSALTSLVSLFPGVLGVLSVLFLGAVPRLNLNTLPGTLPELFGTERHKFFGGGRHKFFGKERHGLFD